MVRPLCCPGCAGCWAQSPAGVTPFIGLAVQVAFSHALGSATAWGVLFFFFSLWCTLFKNTYSHIYAALVAQMVKNSPAMRET